MSVPVVFVSLHDDVVARGYWDQGLIEQLFAGRLGKPAGWPMLQTFVASEFCDETAVSYPVAVYVIPAQHHVEDVETINALIQRHKAVLVILTGDEACVFPAHELVHRRMILWRMTPHPGARFDRPIVEGAPPQTSDLLRAIGFVADRNISVQFRGQVNHHRREEAVIYGRGLPGAVVETTDGFTQGVSRRDYLTELSNSRVVLCPAGVQMPSSFRIYEAIEAGAVPLVDAVPAQGWSGFWEQFGPVGFTTIKEWRAVPFLAKQIDAGWVERQLRVSAWWLDHKQQMARNFVHDLSGLSSTYPKERSSMHPADLVTVVVSTSPIRSHPDTSMIEATIASVREQPDMADVRVIIACDGIRSEQANLSAQYGEYRQRLLWKAHNEWANVDVVVASEHLHQALSVKAALRKVDTPVVLLMEHDTPIDGEVPWARLAEMTAVSAVNVVRFHHESEILPDHIHLMPDRYETWTAKGFEDVPLARTVQWSQRPHLAKVGYYRWMLDTYFGSKSRTMIEDVMHGAVHQKWRIEGDWATHGITIYRPPGNMRRSTHLDGRGDDPKFDMVYEYDNGIPDHAPYPMSLREPE